jgi:hypothetical protein
VPDAADPEEGEGIDVTNGRPEFERRYGTLFSGARSLVIEGVPWKLDDVMYRAGVGGEDVKAIDAPAVGEGRFAVRFYDGEERRIVCLELDASFNYVEEHRVHIAEWLGESYFAMEEEMP